MRFRSGFESSFATFLENNKVDYEYEKHSITFVPKIRRYTPDFYLLDHDMFIETKGLFTSADRAKHLLIKDQHPEMDIRFIFQKANQRLYKGSKTTYSQWCDKHGFKHSESEIPRSWLKTRT
tara:strand:- start:1983 stop:2348 length:366 start_codon:yes stop_codon:yes gene_type:complete